VSHQGRALRMLVLACMMWGLSFPALKVLALIQAETSVGVGTWFFSAATMVARFAISGGIALVLVWAGGRGWALTRSEVLQGLGLGVFGGLAMLFQVDGLSHTAASTSSFLTQGSVFFIPLMRTLVYRSPPTVREGVLCCLTLVGIGILAQFDWQTFRLGRGEAETLVSAALFTGQIMALEVPAFRSNDSLKVSMVMFLTIAALCLPLLWLTGPGLGAALASFASPASLFFLAVLVGPCTLIAFLMMNHFQPHVSATTAGLIYCLEPVFTSFFALFLPMMFSRLAGVNYPNEVLTLPLVTGGGLILLANLFMQWPPPKKGSLMNEHGI
jgi:drug/metabolite transporter (DMT)-like permease